MERQHQHPGCRPGKVIVYNRNELTNRTLRKAGIDTIEIEGSELVRGRGGPAA